MKKLDIESIILKNENLHVIAYNKEKTFIVGVDENTNKAYYSTTDFQADMLSEMPYNYCQWVAPLLKKLNYGNVTHDTETDYYEILIKVDRSEY